MFCQREGSEVKGMRRGRKEGTGGKSILAFLSQTQQRRICHFSLSSTLIFFPVFFLGLIPQKKLAALRARDLSRRRRKAADMKKSRGSRRRN